MKIAKLDLNISTKEQFYKVLEEFGEFVENPSIEEAMDSIQAICGWIDLSYNEKDKQAGYKLHIDKLKYREGTRRGHKILEIKELV